MKRRSPLQRFLSELRRRHVPETAAIYMVAAWAAIQFADVVVPNLGWSDGIVTAVIVAAAVGLPIVLVVAWVFDWDEEGVHRTDPGEETRARIGTTGAGSPGAGASPGAQTSKPWVTAVAVLVVGIASALAVSVVLDHAGGDDIADRTGAARRDGGGRADADGDREAGGEGARDARGVRGAEGGGVPGPVVPPIPDLPPEIMSQEYAESVGAWAETFADIGRLESLEALRGLGERFGEGRTLLIGSPTSWTFGPGPHPLARGQTLQVVGIARDSAGVASVSVDGEVVAQADEPASPDTRLSFTAELTGTGSSGVREVPIVVRTGDGREIRRQYRIQQIPGG